MKRIVRQMMIAGFTAQMMFSGFAGAAMPAFAQTAAETASTSTTEKCTHDNTGINWSGDTYCKDCGHVLSTAEVLHKQGVHDWGPAVSMKQPTIDEEGSITYPCKLCDATRTESIPKLAKFAISAREDGNKIKMSASEAFTQSGYKVLSRGFIWIPTSRLGSRKLTVFTFGRSMQRVRKVDENGIFSYTFKQRGNVKPYTVRAYVLYRDKNGRLKYAYSDPVRSDVKPKEEACC